MDDDEALLMLSERRAARALQKAPELIGYIRSLVIPGGGAADGTPRAPKWEPPLPFRVDAADDADKLYSCLINWSDFWLRKQPVLPPEVRVWRAEDAEAVGLPPGVTPAGAHSLAFLLCRWLMRHHDRFLLMPMYAPNYFADVSQMVNDLRGSYPMAPRPPRKALPRVCGVCGEFAVVARIPQDPRDIEVRCEGCGFVVPWESFSEIVEGWMK